MKTNYIQKNNYSIQSIISGKSFLLAIFCLSQFAFSNKATAQLYTISTYAGGGIGDGYAATNAVTNPERVAVDASGNIYIADESLNRIRKVATNGIITTIAGNGIAGFLGDGGVATAAELNNPQGVSVDASGNVYIADTYNYRIREISSTGTITTIAGNGTAGYTGNGGPATAAELNTPAAIVVGGGNIYVADPTDNVVRSFIVGGNINVYAGTGVAGYGGDGGSVTSAVLNAPIGVAFDNAYNVYIVDQGNNRIRKVNSGGGISTIAGNGTGAYTGDGTAATSASINKPSAVSIDGSYNLYVADQYNLRIRKVVNSTGFISTIAGNGTAGYTGDGGAATAAEVNYPTGITADASANAYIADNGRVRKISSTGIITTYAGGGLGDGDPATAAELNTGNASFNLSGISIDASGNIYFADIDDNRIREVSSNNAYMSTIAGNGTAGYTGDGNSSTAAEIYQPAGVTHDAAGNTYIADAYNNRVRKISSSGTISTIAGNGTAGYTGDGVAATVAELSHPCGLAIDGSGNVYIADYGNNRIRVINASGIISTIAGNGTAGYTGDGVAATATELNNPTQIAIDGSGNIFVSDYLNNRIRKINTGGIISTIAGNGIAGYTGDGAAATAAQLNNPAGIIVNSYGNIYIADYLNNRIRKVSSDGTISTIAGNGTAGFSGDGNSSTTAELNGPTGITMDSYGNLYITDNNNNRIRKLTNNCALNANISTYTNPLCYGSNTGSATVSASNGTTPYTYAWSSGGETTATANNLNAGLCSAFVTDVNGCNATATVTLTSPTALNAIASVSSNPTCHGGNNGSASVTVTGGTPSYKYAWLPSGGTSALASNLTAGTYTCTITDSYSCTTTATVTVTDPAAVLATLTSGKNPCNGSSNGSASVSASGGTSPYTFAWSPSGGNGATAINLAAGPYTCTVTDVNGCTANTSVTLTSPPALVINIGSVTDPSCYGGNNGTATASVTGGTSPYTYSWSPVGGTNVTGTDLAAGSYAVTVTDAEGCNSASIATVSQPLELTGTTNITPASCNTTNGSASIIANGGTTPYKYVWSDGDTSATATALTSGIYQVTVIDANNCTLSESAEITSTNGPSVTATITNVTCSGLADGAINLTVSGNAPFKYLWSKGSAQSCSEASQVTTQNLTNLKAGTYQVIVTDAGGCTAILNINLTQPSVIKASTVITNTGCSLSNGGATVNVSGGTSPYSYSWNHATTTTSANMTSLSAGIYSVSVSDSNGCKDSVLAIVNNTGGPVVKVTGITNVNCGDLTHGAVDISDSGGTSPYTYVWNNGTTVMNLANVSAGGYNVTVTDKTGCKGSAAAMVQSNIPIGLPICMVTVDTNQKNLVIWNRTAEKFIQSYNIYRVASTDTTYNLVGNVCATSYTEFFDSVANSHLLSYTYKISEIDSCGKESPLSPSLNTIHLTVSVAPSAKTINLIWDPYIGAFGNYYYIYRDTLADTYTKYDSVSNTTLSWSDPKPLSTNDTVHYCIGVEGPNSCTPTARTLAINYNATKSNTGNITFNVLSVPQIDAEANSLDVYPNPTTGLTNISISLANSKQTVEMKVLNTLGQVLWSNDYKEVSGTMKEQLDLSGYSKGVYIIQITTPKAVLYRKVTVQ